MHRHAATLAAIVVWLALAAAADVRDMAIDDGDDADRDAADADCVSCSQHKERLAAADPDDHGRSHEDDRAALEEANEAMRAHYRAVVFRNLNITAFSDGQRPPAARAAAAAARRLSLPSASQLAGFRDDVTADGIDGAAAEQYLLLAEDATAECSAVSARRRLCLRFNLSRVAVNDDEATTESAVVVASRLYVWSPRAAFAPSIGSRGAGPLRVRQLSRIARFAAPAAAAASSGSATSETSALDLSSRAVAVASGGGGNSAGWLYYELNRDAVRSSWLVSSSSSGGRRTVEVVLEVSCYDDDDVRCTPRSWMEADFGEHRPFVLVLVKGRDGSEDGGGARLPPRVWRRDIRVASEKPRRSDTGDCGFGTRLYCEDVPAGQQTCCIERLRVSLGDFAKDQIVEPRYFYPNYCRGWCGGLGQQMSYSHTYFARMQLEAMKVHYTPCCVPTSTMSIDILYIDDTGELRVKSMPHMVVDTCGCM